MRRARAWWIGGAAVFALACTSAPREATATKTSASTVEERADPKRLHADVAWLADDAQGGRRAGTEDALRCGEWLAKRFAELGLEPVGDDGYLQRFEVPLPPVDRGGSKIVVDDHLFTGADSVVPAFCSDGGSAEGELAILAYGVENDALGWNDFTRLGYETPEALQGRIALIVRGAPPAPRVAAAPADPNANVVVGTDWGDSAALLTKVMNCKRHGAEGVVVVDHPEHPEVLPPFDAAAAKQASLPVLMLSVERLRSIAPDVVFEIGIQLEHHGDVPVINVFGERVVRIDADVVREKGAATNVLARLPGKTSSRCIVIGAHYDHLGVGGAESLAPGERAVHNGADDNASGTAALLEIARLLKQRGTPECDVIFAAWSGEELGLLGSRHWIEHPTVALDTVETNVNLDMVGRANAKKLQVLGVASAAPFEALLRELGAQQGFELSLNGTGQGIGGSDHQVFLEHKIPALHFFSGVHADYHKPTDDLERFEADGTAATSDLIVALTTELARAGDLVYVEPPKDPNAPAQPTMRGSGTWFGSVPEYAWEGGGVKLAGTSAGSPAEKAGLQKDDILLQVGDVELDGMQDFVYALSLYEPGDTVVARFLRDGREQTVRVTLATRNRD